MRNVEILLNIRVLRWVAWLSLIVLVSACSNAGGQPTHPIESGSTATVDPSQAMTVAQAAQFLKDEPVGAAQQAITIKAYVNQPPTDVDSASAPPANCPAVAARLPSLTDQPFMTAFSVTGVELPNPIPPNLPTLELVIPFGLGMIDLPQSAELHGHVFDPAYASCPDRNISSCSTPCIIQRRVRLRKRPATISSAPRGRSGRIRWLDSR